MIPEPARSDSDACIFTNLVPTRSDGIRRVALLVGVGDYPGLPQRYQLQAPPDDVKAVSEALLDYGFPPQNVCTLVDAQAKQSVFVESMNALAEQTSGDDIVFVFFAGHGSQVDDDDSDENDLHDETLLFHDFEPQQGGMRDDEFNRLLSSIYEDAENIVVALDACNSASGTRGEHDGSVRVRSFPMPPSERTRIVGGPSPDSWYPKVLPNIIVLSAAADGTFAYESSDGGFFTQGLLKALADPDTLTWESVRLQAFSTTLRLSGQAQQVGFEGRDLDKRVVFGLRERQRPLAWRVSEVGSSSVTLTGVPLPGWSEDAVVRLYPDNATSQDLRDSERDLAMVHVVEQEGASLVAEPAEGEDLSNVKVGSIAVLATPGSVESLSIRLAVGPEAGEIPARVTGTLRSALERRKSLAPFVTFDDDADWQFELVMSRSRGALQLRGRSGNVRRTFLNLDGAPLQGDALTLEVLDTLSLLVRQQALLGLRGPGAGGLRDNHSLAVRLVQSGSQPPSVRTADWRQVELHEEQPVPLCHYWQVEVENRSAYALTVGGAILSADGGIESLPNRGAPGPAIRLGAGKKVLFDKDIPKAALQAVPPIGVLEHIVIVGTKDAQPPWDWRQISQASLTPRSAQGGSLEVLQRLVPPARGVRRRASDVTPWTTTIVPFRVSMPPSEPDESLGMIGREYTVTGFDLKKYMPPDDGGKLARVLAQAHWLHERTPRDGVPYKQHGWAGSSDVTNLELGIDCSRTMWFVFTRAGLPYAEVGSHGAHGDATEGGYWPTRAMVDAEGPMSKHFESCLGGPYEIGDVLVHYGWKPTKTADGFAPVASGGVRRHGSVVAAKDGDDWFFDYDATRRYHVDNGVIVDERNVRLRRRVGHTVMVIDPEQYVAFGSHGWDGSDARDTGVEFQRIRAKTWGKWDRSTIPLKACWRHKDFINEAGHPGTRANQPPPGDVCAR